MRFLKNLLIVALACSSGPVLAGAGDPLVETVSEPVRDCAPGWNPNMPLIAWGADGTVAYANGASLHNKGGLLGDAGLSLNLSLVDRFETQLEAYLSCKTPYLRGTLGMLAAAAPVTEFDPRTERSFFTNTPSRRAMELWPPKASLRSLIWPVRGSPFRPMAHMWILLGVF